MAPKMKHPSTSQRAAGSSSSSVRPHLTSEFITRPVHSGRLVDFKFFEEEGFDFPKLLEKQGWRFLFQSEKYFYPELVREFYQNIKFEGDKTYSKVIGLTIEITVESLGIALKVPDDGLTELDHEERDIVVARVLNLESEPSPENVLAKDVSVDIRILHHFVANAIVPKFGRFDMITENELHILFCLLEGMPINLPWLILKEFRKVHSKRKGILPYGIFLTHIFRSAGINLKKENGTYIKGFDIYNAHTLHRMGIHKKEGSWCRIKGPSSSTAIPSEGNVSSDPAIPSHSTPLPVSPLPSISSQPNLVELITQSIMDRLESSGWQPPNSAAGSSSQQISEIQADLKAIKETMENLTKNMEELSGKQAKVEEHILHGTKHQQILSFNSQTAIKKDIHDNRRLMEQLLQNHHKLVLAIAEMNLPAPTPSPAPPFVSAQPPSRAPSPNIDPPKSSQAPHSKRASTVSGKTVPGTRLKHVASKRGVPSSVNTDGCKSKRPKLVLHSDEEI